MANSVTELGTVTLGALGSSDQTFLSTLLTTYNGGAHSGSWTVSGAPGGRNYTYNINPGGSLPGTLMGLNGLSQQGDMTGISGSTSVRISLAGITADYITVKWGQDFEAYYIHGLTGSVTLGNDINRNSISSYTYWNGTRQVPDGGTTVALLGLGLAGVWLFARTQKLI